MEQINYKKEIIRMVNELGEDKEFWDEINNKKSRNGKPLKRSEGALGSSNIRSVAAACEKADCYEEIRLFIQYKIGKGNGWEYKLSNNEVFGKAVIKDMDKIYEMANKNDKEALKIISLYFGYLFWKKTAIEKGEF